MKLLWTEAAWQDYVYWQEHDPNTLRRLNDLIKDARRDALRGIGKPEPLKGDLAGWWSRRITAEHRLVYRVVGRGEASVLEIAACRYHY
jgi:toxin YoeB